MNRIIEIENKIRNSQLLKIDLDFLKSSVNFVFKKHNEILQLNLKEVSKIDLFDESIITEYISHLKFLKNSDNQYSLSLDPYDEQINKIEKADNYLFVFKNYSFKY